MSWLDDQGIAQGVANLERQAEILRGLIASEQWEEALKEVNLLGGNLTSLRGTLKRKISTEASQP